MLLAACGGTSGNTPASGNTSGGGSAPQASTASTAASSSDSSAHDTIVVATGADITDWNEAATYTNSWFPSTLIFSRLAAMDYGPNFEIHPDMATKWETSDDGLSYTFHLADGIKWHDGTPFTSADVKFTYEGVVPNGGASISTMKHIDTIETPDDKTVVIKTKGVYAPFIAQLALYPRTEILPKHLYEGTDWKKNPHNAEPVGTGPFKFEKRVPGEYVLSRETTTTSRESPAFGVSFIRSSRIRMCRSQASRVTKCRLSISRRICRLSRISTPVMA